ncbi:gluconate 2-dehydrogenase subunit 3 family protein [Sphingobacterium spiritivorum]|uniref:gluconate 2-dehydrogenase subunit 3 family protein n=1 Tax=Sphingobacterium spiritivorum TaxID=258 RepID=UPI00191B4BD9|nr:gluconate 2-dehydrogenase subunit 3 family protein [Sphingobacterium spiritivorum]QQT27253.1 gluconate 2-dehydrogenase subunit 3 family protein [Sphingobacterium spiritivorum]
MNRRTAVKQLFIIAGGLALLPSCLREQGGTSIDLHTIKLSAKDEEFLAKLVDVLIPETDSPGGKKLNLHLFIMKMVDDCHSPEDQKAFLEGLEKNRSDLDGAVADKIGAYFKSEEEAKEKSAFYKIFKKRATQGYLNSEYVMKNKLIYELVPGRYNGAMKINA